MATVREKYGLYSPFDKKDFLAGMECEIEGVANYAVSLISKIGWGVTEDGSLRNSGREFISTPFSCDALIEAFKGLHTPGVLTLSTQVENFSERTSVHVHVNCLDVETTKVKDILMWYALFEPYFFMMVNPNRKDNIHCVQLNQTTLPEFYKRPLEVLTSKWTKYTALNLLPLKEFGTIEFRHMHGTSDAVLIESWVRTLKNLWEYGQNNPMTAYVMSSPDQQRKGFEAIFTDAPNIVQHHHTIPFHTRDSSIDVKLGLI